MMQDHGHQLGRKQIAVSPEVAMANDVFDQFCNASTLKSILGHFRHLCELLNMRPNTFPQFYPKFKSKLRSWKAQALWKKFDQRANHKCYNRGKASSNTRVLIIGGGPCGLRSAIEAQLLGAKVVVIEKRDRMSRNNVLHLWPFVIQDLRSLGAKKFFGKFCAGSIDHISIRQLQCILLKVSLILGVEFYEGVSFDSLIPPPDNQDEGKIGWRAKTTPSDHPVSQYEFDVLIGADGKRNTLDGFKRKEFRGKLAIAITANFINKRTEAEARVEEISGVAFIFNQKFFKELYKDTGIDLENIVYYKDDTHYFVMTAKKHSLIDKGVIQHDHPDTAKLLAKDNVDRDALMLYAREAADFSTQYQMMDMEFAVNHYGQPDVAMFDFTSMYAAENASRIVEKNGHRLLMILVGDSLLEPFWPTGSGCARGFLSSMDAGWAIKSWSNNLSPLEVIAERESIYRLLGQTTPENLNRDYAAYTLDPHTRYPNLNVRSVSTVQVIGLLDTDDPDTLKQPLIQTTSVDIPKKRKRRDIQIHPDTLLNWLQRQVALYDNVQITDMTNSFKDGLAICAIIHRYRPDLIDFYSLKSDETEKNNQLAYDVLEKELGISPIMTGEEMVHCDVPDKLAMFSYLTQIYEAFRGEIPHIKHPKLEPEADERPLYDKQLAQLTKAALIGRITKHEGTTRTRHSRSSRHNNENVKTIEKKIDGSLGRRSRKRRSNEKMGASVDRDPKMPLHHKGGMDEDFSGRIKNFEDKLRGNSSVDKKPRDLLRAIGKIEKTDWNVKEIEKKIEESKMSRGTRQDRERVPKWSREQFLARQIKMEKKGIDIKNDDDTNKKYTDIDNTLKNIDRKIKEGNILGHNKVSAMAEQFINKHQQNDSIEQLKIQRSNSKAAIVLPTQGGSETCHFCDKRVYLMERLSAEGKFFHRGCFRCEYCSTSLRIGNHTFDRDKSGGRFYCTQHFGLTGTIKTRIDKKKLPLLNKENINDTSKTKTSTEKSLLKPPLNGVAGLDLLDRGQTPERIEFENLAGLSDAEEAHSQMDEDEWTDRNFGASAAEMGSSDDISDMSDSDDENEIYEEAIDQPLTTEGTIELAKNWTLRYSTNPQGSENNSDTGSNEYEDSSDEYTTEDEESGTATEDEDDVRARELRKQEVWLKAPPRESDDTETGSETEVKNSTTTKTTSQININNNSSISNESINFFDPLITNDNLNNSNLNSNGDKKNIDHVNIDENTENLSEKKKTGDGCSSTSSRSNDFSYCRKNSSTIESCHIDKKSDDFIVKNIGDNYCQDKLVVVLPDLVTSSPISPRKKSITLSEKSSGSGNKLDDDKIDKPMDSFDILKQELRLRREKKNNDLAQLRPLSRETARSKMNEYFEKKEKEKFEGKICFDNYSDNNFEDATDDLEIKSHVSSKIHTKDLKKYFEKNSIENLDFTNLKIDSSVLKPGIEEENLTELKSKLSPKFSTKNHHDDTNGFSSNESNELKKNSNDDKIKRISIIESEIILPKEKVLITAQDNINVYKKKSDIIIPKKPERKNISLDIKTNNDDKNFGKKDYDSVVPSVSNVKVHDNPSNEQTLLSKSSNKCAKKTARSDQERNKKDKCLIS